MVLREQHVAGGSHTYQSHRRTTIGILAAGTIAGCGGNSRSRTQRTKRSSTSLPSCHWIFRPMSPTQPFRSKL